MEGPQLEIPQANKTNESMVKGPQLESPQANRIGDASEHKDAMTRPVAPMHRHQKFKQSEQKRPACTCTRVAMTKSTWELSARMEPTEPGWQHFLKCGLAFGT